ncbi:hypothetical protein [Sinomonas albida]|uniref:hypothetical protein n=1 Tax=Sinomonas albida TaxID=369942 RepID=UPI00301B2DEB
MDRGRKVGAALAMTVISGWTQATADGINQRIEFQKAEIQARQAQIVSGPAISKPADSGPAQFTVDADGNTVSTEKEITTQEDPPPGLKWAPDPPDKSVNEDIYAKEALDRLREQLEGDGFEDNAFDERLQGFINGLDEKPEFDDTDKLQAVKDFLDDDLANAVEEQRAELKESLDADLADAVAEQQLAREDEGQVKAGLEIEIDEMEIVEEAEYVEITDGGVDESNISETDELEVGPVEEMGFGEAEEIDLEVEAIEEPDVEGADGGSHSAPPDELAAPPEGAKPPEEAATPAGPPPPESSAAPPAEAPPSDVPPEPQPH